MKLLSICVVLVLLCLSGVAVAKPWSSSQIAALGSIEAQLRSDGMHWTQSPGEICLGAYVQDILEGRLNQPGGRGAIGRVTFVYAADNHKPLAVVDFGRGYSAIIYFSELSCVSIPELAQQPQSSGIQSPLADTSAEIAASHSIECQLRSHGMRWICSLDEIGVGVYVEDMVKRRPNQPAGRGAIGKVTFLYADDQGTPLAVVDFGRGYVTPISLAELWPVTIVPIL